MQKTFGQLFLPLLFFPLMKLSAQSGSGTGDISAKGPGIEFNYVCTDAGAGGYEAFPDVCKMKNGDLICVLYAGNSHISMPTDSLPLGGRLSYCISTDEGKNWSLAKTFFDGPDDDRDPSIAKLKNGKLICSFFSLRKSQTSDSLLNMGTWVTFSNRKGRRWKKPILVSRHYYCSSPVRQLSNGRLILGLYTDIDGKSRGAVSYSDNGGRTWSKEIDIDNAGFKLDAETDIIQLIDGSLYAIQRPTMAASKSFDRGQTWTVSEQVGFGGHAPYLHRTTSGAIILSHRLPGTSMKISTDEAISWSENIIIDEVHGAYPSMVNLSDGSVLVVYYEEGNGSNIRAKRFRINGVNVQWLSL
jgi:sialidase-1